MIDVRLIETNYEVLAKTLQDRNMPQDLLEKLKILYQNSSAAKKDYEDQRAKQNALSKEFGLKKSKKEDVSALEAELIKQKEMVQEKELIQRQALQDLQDVLLFFPNILSLDTPIGKDENDNVEIKQVLEKPSFDFTPRSHDELGLINGWIDLETAARLSKSRFSVLKNTAAKLERALISYMLDFNSKRGFNEVWLPCVANKQTLTNSGQLPKFEDDLFKLSNSDLYLIPTAEVPLVNLYADTIISENLPILLTAHTSCFRKEAGSAGKDTKGIIRQHQFDKVELVAFSEPENSDKIFEQMVQTASDLLSSLGLAHRLVRLCSGDIGFGAAKTIDLEVWLPSQNKYREISSVSNMGDFQSRRAKIRYKSNGKNTHLHTLNGSSLAVGRTLVAIMENYQDKSGNIKIPAVLKDYIKD